MHQALFLTRDSSYRETKKERLFFSKVRRSESAYSGNLKKIAKHVNDLVKSFDVNEPEQISLLEDLLRQYSGIIRPWARATALRMLADVSRRDSKVWREYGESLGRNLRLEIQNAPTGEVMRDLLNQQVELITSLPLDAAKRVHELAIGTLYSGERPASIVEEIMKTGAVTTSRAMLIARTEVGCAASALTQARAQYVGSIGYIWRSSGDADVRPALGTKGFAVLNTLERGSHRKLNGTFHRWDNPPIAGANGERAHAGCIYNCRCYPEPVLPDFNTGRD